MKAIIKIALLIIFGMITICLQGCSYTVPVKGYPLIFDETTVKLPLNIGIFIDDETRNYILKEKVNIASLNFQLGEALEPAAVESLGKIFKNVSVVKDKNNISPEIERIIVLSFGSGTIFDHGPFTVSQHSSSIRLHTEVYNRRWKLLWESRSLGSVTMSSGSLGFGQACFGPFGEYARIKDLGRIVNESLVRALEQMNDNILTSGKDALLKSDS